MDELRAEAAAFLALRRVAVLGKTNNLPKTGPGAQYSPTFGLTGNVHP